MDYRICNENGHPYDTLATNSEFNVVETKKRTGALKT